VNRAFEVYIGGHRVRHQYATKGEEGEHKK
jgi:hypothetical protein